MFPGDDPPRGNPGSTRPGPGDQGLPGHGGQEWSPVEHITDDLGESMSAIEGPLQPCQHEGLVERHGTARSRPTAEFAATRFHLGPRSLRDRARAPSGSDRALLVLASARVVRHCRSHRFSLAFPVSPLCAPTQARKLRRDQIGDPFMGHGVEVDPVPLVPVSIVGPQAVE